MNHDVTMVTDLVGRKIVVINNIRFKGKRKINWNDVELYLKQYIKGMYEIADTKYLYDIVNIKKETSTPLEQ